MRELGPQTVLVVEDDASIRREVCALLAGAGFAAQSVGSVGEAEAALERDYDLVVLDLGLPDGDGLDLCRELRRAGATVPIVVLTARDAPAQRVRGLDLGADDYVIKPFHPRELVARVRSVLRRAGRAAPEGRLQHGPLWADREAHRAGRGSEVMHLTPREFSLFYFLMQHPGRAWTRDQLIDRAWGDEFDGDPRAVDLYVRRLRAAIEDDAADPRWIQTVWGVGYRMSDEA